MRLLSRLRRKDQPQADQPTSAAQPLHEWMDKRRDVLQGVGKILSVDDQVAVRMATAMKIRKLAGADLVEASSVESALAALRRQRFVAMILDFRLDDGGTGADVLEQATREGLKIPPTVLYTSDAGTPEVTDAARRFGVKVLPKPTDDLVGEVLELLGRPRPG
jgi:DNA-binding NtrC family response regulator